MQWTSELDGLLNQCVFESGYDFTAAAALLLSRARQLRLVSGDDRVVVSSDECQVRWMEINPVIEEEEEEEGVGHGEDEDEAFFRRSFHEHDDDFHFYRRPSDVVEDTIPQDDVPSHEVEVRPVERTVETTHEASMPVDVPEGCPRLELSLSDADLDALLNSLPDRDASAADPKRANNAANSSEMQWVLSFLSDPDEAAHHDAEAKNLFCESGDRADDDNFQYFLQQLNNANLMSPEKPIARTEVRPSTSGTKRDELDASSDEDDDSDDDDWIESRKHIKTAGPNRTSPKTAPSHKRRLEPRASHADEVLPPAAPVRFPPKTELFADSSHCSSDDDAAEDSDDNGLDGLPRYEPSTSARLPLRMPPRDAAFPKPQNSTKLLALSQEIGQQLRKHGEFQFPKRLFRDHENAARVEVDQEQVPEDEP